MLNENALSIGVIILIAVFSGAAAGGIIGFSKFDHLGFILGIFIGGTIGFLAAEAGYRLWDIITYTSVK